MSFPLSLNGKKLRQRFRSIIAFNGYSKNVFLLGAGGFLYCIRRAVDFDKSCFIGSSENHLITVLVVVVSALAL